MKYLDILIKIIFNTIKETFKFLMKTPPAVIEWAIIGIFLAGFAYGIYGLVMMIFG